LDFHKFRNEEWFQLFTEFRDLALKLNPEALNITAQWATFLILYAEADTALEIIRKSADTVLMAEADHVRDQTFRGFVDAVKSARNHFDPQKRTAAEQLSILFDHFGNLAGKAPNEETEGIYNLLQELNGAYADRVQALSLQYWTVRLAADNGVYEAFAKNHNTAVAQRSGLHMKEVRREMQEVYYCMVERIEATIILNGEMQPFVGFVTEWNAFLKCYFTVLAQRQVKGLKMNKKTKKIICFFRKCITLFSEIVTIAGVIGIGFAYWDYKNTKNEQIERRNERIEIKLEKAKFEFKETHFKDALKLFKELQEEKPNDLTGYNLFLQISKEYEDKKDVAMEFLRAAQSLHPTPSNNEANNLIEQYNQSQKKQ
jgi:hypothetical protein